MYIFQSWLASAIILSLPILGQARVAQHKLDTVRAEDDAGDEGTQYSLAMKKIFKKRQTEVDCSYPSSYYNILNSTERGDEEVQTFCNRWIGIPPKTVETTVTPTITVTASVHSTRTSISTTRSTLTETITTSFAILSDSTRPASTPVIATTTTAPKIPRNVNLFARVNQLIDSVVQSGMPTTTTAAVSGNSNKFEDDRMLSIACTCMDVEPTSTITSTYTAAPTSTTTVKYWLRFEALTTTKTVTTVINEPATEASASLTLSTSDNQGLNTSSNLLSPTMTPSTTAPPSLVLVATGSIAPTAGPVGPRLPVVIGFPFSCPKSTDLTPRFVVGDFLYEYSVQCDKAIVSNTSIGLPQEVADATACAELCSLVNEASRGSACGAAQFTPIVGSEKGTCTLSGPAQSIIDQPGSIAIALISTSSSGGCDAISPQVSSINTNFTVAPAAVLASVSAASYSRSIPGFQTRSEGGGADGTAYTSYSTDSMGGIYWSFAEVFVSSTAWQEIYRASWSACPQGISTPPGLPASTTGDVAAFSTGFSTAITLSVGGGGAQKPSPASSVTGVVAPTGTGSQEPAIYIISGQSFFSTSTGRFGIIPPPSATLQSVASNTVASNQTFLPSGGDAFTSSGAASTLNFTAGGGSLRPTGTGDEASFATSFSSMIANSTGANGAIPPSSAVNTTVSPPPTRLPNVIELTIGGQFSSFYSTGGLGSLGPVPVTANSSVSSPTAASSAQSPSNSTSSSATSLPIVPPTSLNNSLPVGTAVFSTGGAFTTYFSTGGFGAIPPSPTNGTQPIPVSQSPGPTSLNGSLPVGTAVFSTGSAFTTYFSTGGFGAIPPSPTNGTQPALGMNQSASVSSGTGIFITASSTLTAFSSGASGAIPPLSLNASGTAPTILPTIRSNSTILAGSGPFTLLGGTAVTLSTGLSGVIPPSPSVNASATLSGTGQGPLSSQGANFTLAGSTGISLSTGASGAIPPVVNVTTAPPSSIPSPSNNASIGSISDLPRTPDFHRSSTIPVGTGASTGIPAIVNSTATPVATRPSTGIPVIVNATTITMGTGVSTGTPTTVNATTIPVGTGLSTSIPAILNSTSVLIILPSSSKPQWGGYGPPPQIPTTTVFPTITSIPGTGQASITLPPLSANSSSPVTNSTDWASYSLDEDERRRRSRSTNPSIQFPTASINSTALPIGTVSGSIPAPTSNTTLSSFLPPPAANSTAILPTGTASLFNPLPSANSSGLLPTVLPPFNSSALVGTGTSAIPVVPSNTTSLPVPSTSYSGLPSVTPTASLNSSRPIGTATSYSALPSLMPSLSLNTSLPTGTGTSAYPVGTSNSTGVLPTGTQSTYFGIVPTLPANSTGFLPTGTASSSFLAPPANISVLFPTYSAIRPPPSVTVSPVTANSTGLYSTRGLPGTAISSGWPVPSSNLTIPPGIQTSPPLSLNSAAGACPTAASYSVIARVAVITTTYYETVPVGPATCLPTATASPPLPSANGTFPTSPILPSTLPLPSSPRIRRSGEIATAEQIATACEDTGNQVLNPNFALEDIDDTSALKWTTLSEDPSISFRLVTSKSSISSPDINSPDAPAARVLATAPGAYLALSQSLTLCPGRQYALTSYNRQGNLLNKCTVDYLFGDDLIARVSPQEVYLKREALFTAGKTAEDVSKDLMIRTTCLGAGASLPMEVNFRGVEVVLVG